MLCFSDGSFSCFQTPYSSIGYVLRFYGVAFRTHGFSKPFQAMFMCQSCVTYFKVGHFDEPQEIFYVQCPIDDRDSHLWSLMPLLGAQGDRVGLQGIKIRLILLLN